MIKTILIIKPSSLGDVIHTLPALDALRKLFPRASIHWLIHPAYAALLPSKPCLDGFIEFPRSSRSLGPWLQMIRALHRLQPDLTLDFQGLLRSGLSALVAGGERVGFREAREGSSFCYTKSISVPVDQHAVLRNLGLLRTLGLQVPETSFPLCDLTASRLRMKEVLGEAPGAALCPGARWPSKRWPEEKFASLARKLSDMGLAPVVVGSKDEVATGDRIVGMAGTSTRSLAGQTTLTESAALLSLVKVVVSVDTGLLHLASALQTPTVALFGPTSENRTGPWAVRHVVVRAEAPCAPCFKKICAANECMMRIEEERVLAEVKSLMAAD